MRILYVLDSLAPGGTERSTVVLAGALQKQGVVATIVTLRTAEHDLADEAEAAGVTVRGLQETGFVRRVRELRRIIRRGDWDVVHTALFEADQVGRLAAWGTGVPVVSSFVNTPYDEHRFADPNVTRWKVRVVQMIDAITGRLMVDTFHSVSEGVRVANARALRIPLDRVVVAERGRDAEALGRRSEQRRSLTRQALGIDETVPVVLNLGRLDHQKGQSVLIEAAELLAVDHPDLVVLIAGKDGSASRDVHELLERRPDAARHVRLLGHRTDVGDLLCAADVLAVSSHFEGTAGAAVEAMALETPIVSTDLVGVRGILEHDRNAVLVAPGDAREMADALERVLGDVLLAGSMSRFGRLRFDGQFTLAGAAERMREVYSSVTTSR